MYSLNDVDRLETRVIAEIGINHNGSMDIAARLINSAARAGCWGIKFQYRNLQRTYSKNSCELGDEMLSVEIEKNYLTPEEIFSLTELGRKRKLHVGISFFNEEDVDDFKNFDFDFYKIPSPELMNHGLIRKLLDTKKSLLISCGMHEESELIETFEKFKDDENWIPLHCISNYPVSIHNACLNFIDRITVLAGRDCGYSSHDSDLMAVLWASTLNLPYIERHLTENKEAEGLDHSTSSTEEEFKQLVEFIKKRKLVFNSPLSRTANQGEKINRQNLGRSWYAINNIKKGEILSKESFVYRSPQKGCSWSVGNQIFKEKQKIFTNINKDECLDIHHIQSKGLGKISNEDLNYCKKFNIGIPVRPYDFSVIRKAIPCKNYEFHLSYDDVNNINEFRFSDIKYGEKYSVHLPDYIDSTTLIDPFSLDHDISLRSKKITEKTVEFSRMIENISGNRVPIVASYSNPCDIDDFYCRVSEYIKSLSYANFTMQWLPPFAWYFGGSVRLKVFEKEECIADIIKNEIKITLDISHFILGSNYYGFDKIKLFDLLSKNIIHIHLSDGSGFDGEGLSVHKDSENKEILQYALNNSNRKILEAWQGHINNGTGFIDNIHELRKLKNSNDN
jgi:sialic acid synthase SpsE